MTEAGILRPTPFVDSETAMPPAGAMPDKYAVQGMDVPAEIDADWHATVVRVPSAVARAAMETELVLETPPALTVIVAVSVGVDVLVATEKLADIAPAATVRDAGTVKPDPVADTPTASPPAGAATFSVAVQVDDPPAVMLTGLQLSVESAGILMATDALFVTPAVAAIAAV